MQLIRGVTCFDPGALGERDVLVAGGQILAVEAPGTITLDAAVLDGQGHYLIPGIVDALTHPCGGGGEGGFGNRTPEIGAETFIRSGVTTPVAALGTDSLGRSLDVLYGNVMGLNACGVGALMYTGAYRVPVPTLTGDVPRDLYLVDPVVGVGEVAIADHRGSQPTAEELRRLAADTALGGTLAGRGGTVLVHVGDGNNRLALLGEALADSDLPASVFYPTHVNRSKALLNEAIEWARRGGFVDITVSTTPELIAAGDIPAAVALDYLLTGGAPADRITLSSDAGGSLPLYVDGVLKGLTAAEPSVMAELLGTLDDPSLRQVAIAAMTINPATALRLPDRGRIRAGARADLVLISETSGEVRHVMTSGQWRLRDGEFLPVPPFP